MVRCPSCGADVHDDAGDGKHCPACGAELEVLSQPTGGDGDDSAGQVRLDKTLPIDATISNDLQRKKTIGSETIDDQSEHRATVELGESSGEASATDVTFDAAEHASSVADEVSAIWSKTLSPQTDANQTVRLDGTVTTGGKSTLVIRSRALHEASAEDAPTADYELLDVIGEGGMGVVYAARQASVDRLVALKMLKATTAEIKQQREKFISEAVVTGDLEHPNIVPIYELGTNESGALFYSMKRVKGTPWVDVIRQKSQQENLEILMKACDAVAFAHANGVVHRDLKPENIMLGDYGEVLVMDWGLALATEDFRHSETITQTTSMGGTPAYMPPEMATGPIERIGFSSDVYLLGAILYEIVAEKLPHNGRDVMDCLQAAAANRIQPTEKTGELLDIALKAMATDPADRYANVQEIQSAIREYQSHGQSIVLSDRAAKELATAEQTDDYQDFARAMYGFQEALTLWSGNKKAAEGLSVAKLAYARSAQGKGDFELGLSLLVPGVAEHDQLEKELKAALRERNARQQRLKVFKIASAALVALVFLVITGAFFLVSQQRDRAKAAEKDAKGQRDRAIVAEGDAKDQRDRALLAEGEAKGQRDRAIVAEGEAKALAKSEAQARRVAEDARQIAERAKVAEEYESYVARIGLAAAKIDENAFDVAVALLDECDTDLRHWEWGRLRHLCQQSVQTFEGDSPVDAVAFAPDGDRFITGGWDGKARMWDVATGKLLWTAEQGQYVHSVAYSPDGRYVATGASDGAVQVRNAEDGQPIQTLEGHGDSVLSVAFSSDGRRMLSSSYDNTARLWEVETGRELFAFRGHTWWVWTAAFSPDEESVVTASHDGRVIVWSQDRSVDRVEFRRAAEFVEHDGPVYTAAFSPDGKYVVSGGYDKRLLVWDPAQIRTIDLKRRIAGDVGLATQYRTLEGHTGGVRAAEFSADGKRILSGSQDNAIKIWDAASGQLIKSLRGHGGWVRACVFSPDGKSVLSASHDGRAKLWDVAGYEEVRVLQGRVFDGHTDAVLAATFSRDGQSIVTASRDRSARTWDFDTGKPIREFKEGHEFLASSAVFFADGKKLLTGADDNTVRMWDVRTGTEERRLDRTGRSGALALSYDGRWIATGSDDKAVKIWNAVTGELVETLADHAADVTTVAFSHDARWLMSGDALGRCRLWRYGTETGRWELARRMDNHNGIITAIAFSPDDRTLLTASGDRSVGHWDVATGQEVVPLILKHPDWVTAMAVAPDGRVAVTSCEDGTVRLWDTGTAREIGTLIRDGAVVNAVAFSADGETVLTASAVERTVRLWDLATREGIAPGNGEKQGPFLDMKRSDDLLWWATLSPDGRHVLTIGGNDARMWDVQTAKEQMSFSPHGAVASARFSPDGTQIVTGSWDNSAKIWDAETGKAELKLVGGHEQYVNSADFSPDGAKVLTASDDATAKLWDAKTGKRLGVEFLGHTGRVRSATFSPDGRRVLTASSDKTARVWDAETGRSLLTLGGEGGHAWPVLCAEFSQDGRRAATGSEDNTAKIWDIESGELLLTFKGHTAAVTSTAFSPDGRRLLTGSADNTAKLWDAATGKEILTLSGHDQSVTSIRFSPDGRHALSASRDGTAIVWLAEDWK